MYIIPESKFCNVPLSSHVFILKTARGLWLVESSGSPDDLLRELHSMKVDPRSIKGVFITHGHFDHVLGLSAFQDSAVPIYIHRNDLHLLRESLRIKASKLKVHLINGEELFNLSEEISMKVIHTPGHTPGSVCFYIPEVKLLFTGDTVFTGGYVGRTDLPGGNFSQLCCSIKALSALPICHLLPSHGTIAVNSGHLHLLKALTLLPP